MREGFQIFIKSDITYTISILPEDTVATLEKLVKEKIGMPHETKICLVYAGIPLKFMGHNAKMSDFNLRKEATIQLL